VLHRVEAKACGILRLSPEQYINSKLIILTAAKEYKERSIPFRKVDAQRLVRIDVNKACKLWEFFSQAGWIHN
ncbi:3816_t:CDS:1, partial [Racocetra persica]